MKIKEITIENFRSYYGRNTIKFNDGLMLFVGDNGDGKTTFFEAIEWLLDTTNTPNKNMNIDNISKKKLVELSDNDSANLYVSIIFDHDGEKIVEKSFTFKKVHDNIQCENFQFKGWYDKGVGREQISGEQLLDRFFDAAIRKYCLFKGEENLNIFKDSEALKYLIDTFSNVNQFNPYYTGDDENQGFTDIAEKKSLSAYQKVMKSDNKNSQEEKELRIEINNLNERIDYIDKLLKNQRENASKYTTLIEELENSKDISNSLKMINDRLKSLNNQRVSLLSRIDEEYSIKLLDDMWILCAFPKVLQEFQNKINVFCKEKRRLEDDENQKKAKQEVIQDIKNGFIPLSIYIPDAPTMEEMIKEEVCKVCGRPAKKGTDAYKFMVDKLNELLKENNPDSQEDAPLFPNNYAKELEQRSITLGYNKKEINNLHNVISKFIEFNASRQSDLKKVDDNISKEEENKKKLLAQNDSLSEEQLQNVYVNISNWVNQIAESNKKIGELETEKEEKQDRLNEVKTKYKNLAKNSQASTYCKVYTALCKIKNAFKEAKEKNSREFLSLLQDNANEYLEKLNVDGFHGTICVFQKPDKSARIELQDKDGMLIKNPNQALKTTMYMSVLFAVSNITNKKREEDYPLIFDAPTSSFAPQKECDFFNIISEIQKQCIIFSKSFLTEDGKIDTSKIDSLNCTIYRMEKKKPFNRLDLTTIETILTKIK